MTSLDLYNQRFRALAVLAGLLCSNELFTIPHAIAETATASPRPPTDPSLKDPVGTWTIQGQLTTIDTWTATSPMSGVVDELLVREGDQVQQGKLLARMNDALLKAESASAQAAQKAALLESDQHVDIEYAQMTAAVRKAELQRSKLANEVYPKSVSSIELERQQLLLNQAQLSAEQSMHKQLTMHQHYAEKSALVDLILVKLAKTKIQSPLNGTVVEVIAKPGQWLSEGTPLLRVINLDRLKFESLVDFGLAKELKVGQMVTFTLVLPHGPKPTEEDHPDEMKGRLTFVSPEVNPVTRQVRIMAEIENIQHQLQPGMPGQLRPALSPL
jgi:multidrug efflux pump subunit AcrA (membrane-fusion protein)